MSDTIQRLSRLLDEKLAEAHEAESCGDYAGFIERLKEGAVFRAQIDAMERVK